MLYYQFSYFCKRLFININSLHLVSCNVINNRSSIVQKGIGIAILMVAYFEVRVLMYLTLLISIAESYYLYLSAVFAFPPRSYVIAMRDTCDALSTKQLYFCKLINWKFQRFAVRKLSRFVIDIIIQNWYSQTEGVSRTIWQRYVSFAYANLARIRYLLANMLNPILFNDVEKIYVHSC